MAAILSEYPYPIDFIKNYVLFKLKARANYQVLIKLQIYPSQTEMIETPEILLDLDNNNVAKLPLDILRYYFSVDIPVPNKKYSAAVLKNTLFKYRILYAEVDPANPVVNYSISPYFYATSGRMKVKNRELNLPDWISAFANAEKISKFKYFQNFGCDSGLTVPSFMNMPQYLYFLLFNILEDEHYTNTLKCEIDILLEDGSTIILTKGNLLFQNYTIIRIPVSVEALGITEHALLAYTVKIYNALNESVCFTRTFRMIQTPFSAKIFFLRNRHGVLESFYVDNEMKERELEGEPVGIGNRTEIDLTGNRVVFTARTGYKTNEEMQLLSEAVESRFNYKLEDGEVYPITILPDSFVIKDEAEDLQSAEFRYIFNIEESGAGIVNEGYWIIDENKKWQDTIEIDGVVIPRVWRDDKIF